MISQHRNLCVKALIPPGIVQYGSPPSLTNLLATEDVTESTAHHSATNVTADVVPPPKRKKQRMTELALQKKQAVPFTMKCPSDDNVCHDGNDVNEDKYQII